MSTTSHLEEIPEFRKHTSLVHEDRSYSAISHSSTKREASPTIQSFKHLRNYRLEAKAQKRDLSLQKEEQIDSFLGKVTELEAEWATQKSQTPSMQFITTVGSRILGKQEYFRSSHVSSPNSVTLNSIQTDRPVYEPLFAQKIKDPKQEHEQNQLFVFKDEVIPEKVPSKKNSKSITIKKHSVVEKTEKLVSPRNKPATSDSKTILSKKQSYQTETARYSPRRVNTVDDEQFVIACQPQLLTKNPYGIKKIGHNEVGNLSSPKIGVTSRISIDRVEDRSSMISTASDSKDRILVISKARTNPNPTEKQRAESPTTKHIKPKTAEPSIRITGTPNSKKTVPGSAAIKSRKVIDFPLPTEPAKIKTIVVKKTTKDTNKHFVITQADLKANIDIPKDQKENECNPLKLLEVPRDGKKIIPMKCPPSPHGTKFEKSPVRAPNSASKKSASAKESIKIPSITPLSEKKSPKKSENLNERDKLYNDILEKLDREQQRQKAMTTVA